MSSTFTSTLANLLLILVCVGTYGMAVMWVVCDLLVKREDEGGKRAPDWCWRFLDMWGLL